MMQNHFGAHLKHVCRRRGRGASAPVWAALGMVLLLSGCAARKTPAPVVNLSSVQVAAHTAAGTYTVKAGDTLFSIARRFNTSVAELVRWNDLLDPNQLWAGQVLHLRDNAPAASHTAAPAAASRAAPPTPPQTARATPAPTAVAKPATSAKPAASAKLANSPKADVKPTSPATTKPPATKPATPTSTPTPAQPPALAWGWPAQGKIIRNFSADTKGIDIAGKAGDPVRAAAAGIVRYVGNGVRGLGYLVLIEHGNDFMTAYAHNQKLLVKVGQQVKKNERIALLGMSDTTSPRLHFEIRRNYTPVNPLTYLPKK